MQTLKITQPEPAQGVRASATAPIIVATDGQAQSDAALGIGELLAERPEALRIVTVVKALPVIPDVPTVVNPDLEAARRAAARREVLSQMQRVDASAADGRLQDPAELANRVELHDGDPASVVARIAHEAGATMIVAGIGRHRVVDRVFGDETALKLVRMADVPVLSVPPETQHIPRRIVVAVDFSESSLRAARLSLELAAMGATIYLAHVAPRDSTLYDWNGFGSSYKQDAGEALRRTRSQLRIPKDMTVQRVLLQGDPATELLAFAASVNADLIATGSHGHGFIARVLVGSVTTRIVRCSTCSVLTVPHPAVMTRVRTATTPPVVASAPQSDWAAELEAFSRRNIGRRGVLEVDDPEIGAQAQESDYPLLGAAYDAHDQRVQLMFGAADGGRGHLTRSVAGVLRIDLLRDDAGNDVALRLVHGTGQTLLTFDA